jgi:hypothetical protein
VAKVRNLVQDDITDAQIAEVFNREGRLSSTGKPFTEAMIRWIRFKHSICQRTTDKMTVKNLAEKFGISTNVVYYWLKQGLIVGQRKNSGSPYLFTLDAQRENSLRERVQRSTKMRPLRNSTAGGAV